jgi:hypothetical protein
MTARDQPNDHVDLPDEAPTPIARRRQTLLHYRVNAVRSELLEIAAMLDRTHDPEPATTAALHELLINGYDSPLYNPDIHVSELRATLSGVRMGLLTRARNVTPPAASPSVTSKSGRVGAPTGRSWGNYQRSAAGVRKSTTRPLHKPGMHERGVI